MYSGNIHKIHSHKDLQQTGDSFMRPGNLKEAFTLIEILVVVTIIGLISALSLPALKGFGQGNLVNTVSRQLIDDINYARQKAISDRCNVYILFITTNIYLERNDFQSQLSLASMSIPTVERQSFLQKSRRMWTNLVQQQYTAYAIYADRTVGDQPSHKHARYLTEWKTLPEGVMFYPDKMATEASMSQIEWMQIKTNRFQRQEAPLMKMNFHFPDAMGPEMMFPYIGFNYLGELIFQWQEHNSVNASKMSVPMEYYYETIPLIKASGFYSQAVELVEITPPVIEGTTEPLLQMKIDGKTGKVIPIKEEF